VARTATAVTLAGVSALAYGWLEHRSYRLRRVTVPVLAPGQPPLRLLHLSDFHLTRHDRALARWLRGLADLRPDLVVSTGDNVAEAAALPLLAKALEPLFAFPGVFVFGSNDRYRSSLKVPWDYLRKQPQARRTSQALPIEALRALLTNSGWRSAEEARFLLPVAGRTVEIRGTGDAHINRDRYIAVAGPPDRTADLALGVTHAPYQRVLDAMTADGVDLILAGHTHGGQVCLPGFGALVTNCDLDRRQAKGLSTWSTADQTAWLHVSAGLGTSPSAPYRIACPPEASLLTLVSRVERAGGA
jgi:predicted MPP superfamily phosphohydrolase